MRDRVVVQGRRGRSYGRGAGTWRARVLWGTAEAAVTCGLVVLLLVVHQLWWTNRQAEADARHKVDELRQQWERPGASTSQDPSGTSDGGGASDGSSGSSGEGGQDAVAGDGGRQREGAPQEGGAGARTQRPGWEDAYAVMRIPKLGVTAPVAEGVSKAAVLNRGYIGHYPATADPGEPGNFGVAGHRNTHGEPFRYINRLRTGDRIEVETRKGRYVYAVRRTIPETTPGDGTVLDSRPYSSVHPGHRMSGSGYYVTLTTCTPEFTSRYRLVVWGELVSARPR
ncbi:class E sortase [Streptomyces sp. ODS28]|uniref:class E sortase n=1 Tax=Streptomyces sp. ODS28 TaxID=3136688 RepID=UPI0031F136CD